MPVREKLIFKFSFEKMALGSLVIFEYLTITCLRYFGCCYPEILCNSSSLTSGSKYEVIYRGRDGRLKVGRRGTHKPLNQLTSPFKWIALMRVHCTNNMDEFALWGVEDGHWGRIAKKKLYLDNKNFTPKNDDLNFFLEHAKFMIQI